MIGDRIKVGRVLESGESEAQLKLRLVENMTTYLIEKGYIIFDKHSENEKEVIFASMDLFNFNSWLDVNKITSTVYSLKTENGGFLGQVVLTSDGMFSSVTDYGNFSYAWRSFGKDFKDFIISLNTRYFAEKMSEGMAYITYGPKIRRGCESFSERILPALQEAIKLERR